MSLEITPMLLNDKMSSSQVKVNLNRQSSRDLGIAAAASCY